MKFFIRYITISRDKVLYFFLYVGIEQWTKQLFLGGSTTSMLLNYDKFDQEKASNMSTVLETVFRTLAKWPVSPETSRPIRSPRNRWAPPGHLIYLFSVAFMQRIDSLKFLLFSVWFIARLWVCDKQVFAWKIHKSSK